MFPMLLSFLRSFRLYFQSRADLQIEILALRHQIVGLQRQTPKPKLKSSDRRFWVDLSQFWFRWREAFCEQVAVMNIKEVLSAPRSPWQRAYVERVIGSIRRVCLDYVIIVNK